MKKEKKAAAKKAKQIPKQQPALPKSKRSNKIEEIDKVFENSGCDCSDEHDNFAETNDYDREMKKPDNLYDDPGWNGFNKSYR